MSNDSDLRAAAERLESMIGCTVDLENAPVEAVADMWLLAQAFIAKHLSDLDETPIDEAWLRRVMTEDRRGRFIATELVESEKDVNPLIVSVHAQSGQVHLRRKQQCEFSGGFYVTVKTLGGLRRLCRALGVPLGEKQHD